MPRKSLSELSTPKSGEKPVPRLLLPGSHLQKPARAIFAELISSVGEGHFMPIDRPMLEQLSVAIHISRELAAVIDREGVMLCDKVNPVVRHLKAQQALIGKLASRLRLTTQNRISKDKAGTAARHGGASTAEIYELAR